MDEVQGAEEEAEAPDDAWWATAAAEPVSWDSVVVIDIKTTGLERRRDWVWELAATNLGTDERFSAR